MEGLAQERKMGGLGREERKGTVTSDCGTEKSLIILSRL